MSRSIRKTPKRGTGVGGQSEKRDKQIANRRLRRKVKVAVEQGAEGIALPALREVSNVWDMRKDGKIYLGESMPAEEWRK